MKSIIKKAAQFFGYNLKKINRQHDGKDFANSLFLPKIELEEAELKPNSELSRYFLENKNKDIYKHHHYFDIYDKYFNNQKTTTFMEIGVFKGGSLKMWRHFLGAEATIIGVDINEEVKRFEDEKTHIRIGDQADPKFLKSLAEEFGSFDIILDDGGHTATQQINSFLHLYPYVREDGGVYMVEDTNTSFWGYTDTQDQTTFLEFCAKLPSLLYEPYYSGPDELIRKVSPFCASTHSIAFYDSIVVLEKRKKSLPTCELR